MKRKDEVSEETMSYIFKNSDPYISAIQMQRSQMLEQEENDQVLYQKSSQISPQLSVINESCSQCWEDTYQQKFLQRYRYLCTEEMSLYYHNLKTDAAKKNYKRNLQKQSAHLFLKKCQYSTYHLYYKPNNAQEKKRIPMIKQKTNLFLKIHSQGHISPQFSKGILSQSSYYWPNMYSELDNFIKNCKYCLISNMKPSSIKLKTIKQFFGPLECIVVDYCQLILNAKNLTGKYYMLNMVQHLTRYKWTFFNQTNCQEFVIQCLGKVFNQLRGALPQKILTDNGKQFNKKLQLFLKNKSTLTGQGIELIHGRPFHPQTQGAVQRYNKQISKSIRNIFHVNPNISKEHFYMIVQSIVEKYNGLNYAIKYYPKNKNPLTYLNLSILLQKSQINYEVQLFISEIKEIRNNINEFNEKIAVGNNALLQEKYPIGQLRFLYNVLQCKNEYWQKQTTRKRKVEVGTFIIPCEIIQLVHRNMRIKIKLLVEHNYSEQLIKKNLSKNSEVPCKRKVQPRQTHKKNQMIHNSWKKDETIIVTPECLSGPLGFTVAQAIQTYNKYIPSFQTLEGEQKIKINEISSLKMMTIIKEKVQNSIRQLQNCQRLAKTYNNLILRESKNIIENEAYIIDMFRLDKAINFLLQQDLWYDQVMELKKVQLQQIKLQQQDTTVINQRCHQFQNSQEIQIRSIKQDGNCVFRAMSHQLYNSEQKFNQIRKLIVRTLETNLSDYLPLLKKLKITNIEQLIKNLKKNGNYGGTLQLLIVSKLFECS